MRNFAVIAATAFLLGLAGTAAAQELTGSSSGGSSGPSALTASPGQSAPEGANSNFVPPPSHPSSSDYIPDSSENNTTKASRTRGAALMGSGSNNSKNNKDDDGGYRINYDGASTENTEDLYDENGEPFSRQYFQGYPINMRLSFRHAPGLQPGQVNLHIAAPFQVTTCGKISNIPDTVTYTDSGTLKIELKKLTNDFRDLNSDPGYNCISTTHDTPSADILLDRAELKKRNIKTIEISTASQTTDHYDVTLTDHMIRLQPVKDEGIPSVGPSRPGLLRNPLQHWFYPAGTVVVYVPEVPHGQDITDELDRAVRARGLVPLTELWPEFKSPLTLSKLRYYVDKSDKVMKGVPEGETITIGSVTINKTVYGLQGDEIEQKDLPIYARAPNTYE